MAALVAVTLVLSLATIALTTDDVQAGKRQKNNGASTSGQTISSSGNGADSNGGSVTNSNNGADGGDTSGQSASGSNGASGSGSNGANGGSCC